MDSESLVDITFTNICFHELLIKIINNIPEDTEEQKEYMDNDFKDYLKAYEKDIGNEDKDKKLKKIQKYIKNINIKNLEEKKFFDYILNELLPYIKEIFKNYLNILPG
jgi:hypothetical protein